MVYLNDNVLDNGLTYIDTNGSRVDICSQEPADYGEATSTYTLGNKTGVNPDAVTDGSPDGRSVQIPAISDGSVTSTGSATHWALTNGSDTLIAANILSAGQQVTASNTFTLTAFTIRIPDPS